MMDSPFSFFKNTTRTPKLLIVEDDKLLRDAYELIFSKEKFITLSAIDGKDALSKLKLFKPNIILLDLLMPKMNGVEFLQTAKVRHLIPKCKIVVLSNLSDRLHLKDVAEYNVKKVLVKSDLAPHELVATIKTMVH